MVQALTSDASRRANRALERFGAVLQTRKNFLDLANGHALGLICCDLVTVCTEHNSKSQIIAAVREIIRQAIETRNWALVTKITQRHPHTLGYGGHDNHTYDTRDVFLAKELERVYRIAMDEGTKFEALYALFYVAAFSNG